MTTYVLDLPDRPYLTPNSRAHWSKRSAHGRAWRRTAQMLARSAQIPACDHATVALYMHAKDRRRRDEDNLVSGVLKHCIDGLVDAGVIPDDTPKHISWLPPRIVSPTDGTRRHHRWELHVTPTEHAGGA